MDTGYQQMEDQRLADIEKKYIQLQSDLLKLVKDMDEVIADEYLHATWQNATHFWQTRLKELLLDGGERW